MQTLRKYTIAEFRKNVREALNNVEQGGKTFITRHGIRYELVKADIQGGKQQLKEINKAAKPRSDAATTPTAQSFPKNGDSGAQIETADDLTDAFGPLPAGKNIAEANASKIKTNADALVGWEVDGIKADTNTLHVARGLMRNQLNGIDIETQDPEEVELGATLAASIDEITVELKRRGAE